MSVSVGGGSDFAQALALLVWDSASTWPIPLASPRVRAHAPARRSGRLFSKFFRGGAGFGFLRSGEGDGFRSVTMAGRMEPPSLLPVLADCWRGGIRTCIARRRPKAKSLTLVSSRARSSHTERRSARGKESEAEERRLCYVAAAVRGGMVSCGAGMLARVGLDFPFPPCCCRRRLGRSPHLLLPLCGGWLESVCDCALRPSPSKRFGGKGRARVR